MLSPVTIDKSVCAFLCVCVFVVVVFFRKCRIYFMNNKRLCFEREKERESERKKEREREREQNPSQQLNPFFSFFFFFCKGLLPISSYNLLFLW